MAGELMTKDALSPLQRSERMSRIRSGDTKPERALRSALHASGFRFRLHKKGLPGKPDLVFAKYKAVIFVHGCFWHAHTCQKGRIPEGNRAFWLAKLSNNVERDARNTRCLKDLGWRVMVVWECELSSRRLSFAVEEVIAWLIAPSEQWLE